MEDLMRSFLLFLAMATILIGACAPDREPMKPEPGPATGTISVGPFVPSGSVSIGPAGGTVDITDGPISGFQIEVAPDAFPETKTVVVSSAPVTEHSLGPDFNPISPMIRVDYGGGYAEEPMLVRVPVQVPAGHFAMGFYYDEETGEVEGIPVAAITDSEIVLVTQHFSGNDLGDGRKSGILRADTFADILVASVQADKLYEAQDSGFRPGTDDWEFANGGSYIAPGGHCSGQSVTAMWYYSARKLGLEDPPLYDRFSTTSPMWQDNRDGYRFASVVQAGQDRRKRWAWARKFDLIGTTRFAHDTLHYLSFAYAIHLSGRPQLISVRGDEGGHAMVVYRAYNRVLSIADPNFPSSYNHFVILAENGTFLPYESKENADAEPTVYPQIYYVAKTALYSFDGIAARYAEMQRHSIGNYPPNNFPAADLLWFDGTDWRECPDTLALDLDTLTVAARCGSCGVHMGFNLTEVWQLDASGYRLNPSYNNGVMSIPLTAGDNRLYLNLRGQRDFNVREAYIDFKTVLVRKQPIETYPITGITQTTATGGGNIAADGGFPVTARGVCWSNASSPTTADSHTTDGSGTGVFVSNLTGLAPDTLYCVRAYATNEAGTTYGNQVTFETLSEAFYIGQHYGGGVIFYIDGTGQHGFISATSDQSTGALWGCYTETAATLFGTAQELGTGQANTTSIVNGCAEGGIAARICDELLLNGYSDWFLPSRNEMAEMHVRRNEIGGFAPNGYWTSSENTGYNAWVSNFRNLGGSDYEFKNRPFYVRAIRAF
jgi:hypothetical protein